MQSFFGHFSASEFFNSHRRYHNSAPFVRQTGERKAQTCAMAIFQQLRTAVRSVKGLNAMRASFSKKFP
jgi:hypothetical protein